MIRIWSQQGLMGWAVRVNLKLLCCQPTHQTQILLKKRFMCNNKPCPTTPNQLMTLPDVYAVCF